MSGNITNNFLVSFIKQKNLQLHRSILIMPENQKICSKLVKICYPKLANSYEEMYARGEGMSPDIHFIIFCKFGIPCSHKFTTDFYEFALMYCIHNKSNCEAYFLFE